MAQIPCSANLNADLLARYISGVQSSPHGDIPVELLNEPNIRPRLEVKSAEETLSWMTLLLRCLKMGMLLEDKAEATKLRFQASKYLLINDR